MGRSIRQVGLCTWGLFIGTLLASHVLAEGEPALTSTATAVHTPVEALALDGASDKTSHEAKASVGSDSKAVETIRERYPDGKLRVEREVIRDAKDNYVNHGLWKMWDKEGYGVGEGKYVGGKRQGVWTRWFMPSDVPLSHDVPYRDCQGPFVSQAEFDAGKLNGCWRIHDAQQRKISEWHYVAGRRHGPWSSWYANGRKMREANYVNGVLDGTVSEWSPEGVLIKNDSYQNGRKLAQKVEYGAARQKKSEGMYLFAKQELQQEDNWWDAKLSKLTTIGKDERHGVSTAWHPNGQVRVQGAYEHDVLVGTHTWWYANGQKAVEGNFSNGLRHDLWTWFHSNGQKSTHGQIALGVPQGKWIWWNDAGTVTQRVEYGPGKSDSTLVAADKDSARDLPDPEAIPLEANGALVPQTVKKPNLTDDKTPH